jgi:hypothetical protein
MTEALPVSSRPSRGPTKNHSMQILDAAVEDALDALLERIPAEEFGTITAKDARLAAALAEALPPGLMFDRGALADVYDSFVVVLRSRAQAKSEAETAAEVLVMLEDNQDLDISTTLKKAKDALAVYARADHLTLTNADGRVEYHVPKARIVAIRVSRLAAQPQAPGTAGTAGA